MSDSKSNAVPDIRQSQVFNAPVSKVWDAVATAEGIAAWFMPNNFKPEPGYEFEMDSGPFGMSQCKVLEVVPQSLVRFQWGKDWTVTFELKDVGGKTEFTLIHSGWDADKVTEFGQSHREVRDRMNQGWVGLVQKLGEQVEA
ncbi:SRPBCC domain-containing protein [Xylanibacillus composti]|uniref:Activator of Hsp90 ATPase homologue 1/2-like C-terminal domain-containing protein n=1 Tax=Xylanibacillus composti TaxID=1572762 RepID=A0A8J4M2Q0_9BACL|nr:SRPBCC domain-containing protein [Xylanibacillus composti]MDT9726087.1 SRPBCC domain-containing protein [Xylanibacillus composti]GIQ68766.1 hypothetical protein XYCOK13_15900 [Xylanibacillus composti]